MTFHEHLVAFMRALKDDGHDVDSVLVTADKAGTGFEGHILVPEGKPPSLFIGRAAAFIRDGVAETVATEPKN